MSVCLRYCVMHWLYWVLCLGLSSESIHPRHCIVPAHWEERWWHLTATTPSTPFILEYCLLWQKEAKCMTQNLFPKKNLLLIMARSENCWFKVRKGKWEGYFFFQVSSASAWSSWQPAACFHSVSPPVYQGKAPWWCRQWLFPRGPNLAICTRSDSKSWWQLLKEEEKALKSPAENVHSPKNRPAFFAWHRFAAINLEVEVSRNWQQLLYWMHLTF